MGAEDMAYISPKAIFDHFADPVPSPFWVALDLATINCFPCAPLVWDPAKLAASLEVLHPERQVSAAWLSEHRDDVLGFFVAVDGGYLPAPSWLQFRDPLAPVH